MINKGLMRKLSIIAHPTWPNSFRPEEFHVKIGPVYNDIYSEV